MTDNSDILVNSLKNVQNFHKYSQKRTEEYNNTFDNLTEIFNLWLNDVNTKINNGLLHGIRDIAIESFTYKGDANFDENTKYSFLNNLQINSYGDYDIEKQLEIYLKQNQREGRKRRKNFSLDTDSFSINKKAKIKFNIEVENKELINKEDENREQFYTPADSNMLIDDDLYNKQKLVALHNTFNEVIEEMPSKEEEFKISFMENPTTAKKENINGNYDMPIDVNHEEKIKLPILFSEIKNNSVPEQEMNEYIIKDNEGNSINSLNKFNLTELLQNLNESDFKLGEEEKIEKLFDEEKKSEVGSARFKNGGKKGINQELNLRENKLVVDNISENSKEVQPFTSQLIEEKNELKFSVISSVLEPNKNNKIDQPVDNYAKEDNLSIHKVQPLPRVENNFNNSVSKLNFAFTFKKDNKKLPNSQISNLVKDAESLYKKLYSNEDNNYHFEESPAVEKWNPTSHIGSKNKNMITNIGNINNLNTFAISNFSGNESKTKFLNKANNSQSVKSANNYNSKAANTPTNIILGNKNNQSNHKFHHNFQSTNKKAQNINKNEQNIEYQITDKSESSDDDEDDEHFNILDDKNTPFFKKGTKKKKIPSWAESTEYINNRIIEQKKINYKDIFGVCKIDNLDLNIIFTNGRGYDQKRGDSADWRLDNTYSTIRMSSSQKKDNSGNTNHENLHTNRALINELNNLASYTNN